MENRPPALAITVSTLTHAQQQYLRHITNRLCLSILADLRVPALTAAQSVSNTRGPEEPPGIVRGSEVFVVKAERVNIRVTQTQQVFHPRMLVLEVDAGPTMLDCPRLASAMAELRAWPPRGTPQPVYLYRESRQQFELDGRALLTAEIIALFQHLLRPHEEQVREHLHKSLR